MSATRLRVEAPPTDVSSCPPEARPHVRARLSERLHRTVREMETCYRMARELGDVVSAQRLLDGIEHWIDIVTTVEADPR